jgi:hypothetical protein
MLMIMAAILLCGWDKKLHCARMIADNQRFKAAPETPKTL